MTRGILALGLVEAISLGALGWWPGAAFPFPGLALFGVAFASYAWAAYRLPGSDMPPWAIWLVALGLRAILVPLDPAISDDIFRYLWDGEVQRAGINPYLFPPAAPELEHVRTAYHASINNPTVSTIYAPVAQMAFLGISFAGGAILQAKVLWIGLDLATGWILGRVAAATGRNVRRTQLLYLWSPLLVVEVAWSGHLEPLGLLALACTLLWAARPLKAAVALAFAVATKFAPIVALPALARRWGWRPVVAFGVTLLLLYAPYLSAGSDLFSGLGTYAEHWWFMKGPFALLERVAPDALGPRRAAALLVALVVGWAALRRASTEDALFMVLGAGMILTPTLHPWYVLWMLPFAALRMNRAWILLSGLAFLGYYGLGSYGQTGSWPQPVPLRLALWLPFLVLLLYDGVRDSKSPPADRGSGRERPDGGGL